MLLCLFIDPKCNNLICLLTSEVFPNWLNYFLNSGACNNVKSTKKLEKCCNTFILQSGKESEDFSFGWDMVKQRPWRINYAFFIVQCNLGTDYI